MWTTDPSRSVDGNGALPWVEPRKTRIGLVAGGLGAYWPQFPDLLPQLQASARRVSDRFSALDCDVIDFGCDPGEWTDAWSGSGVAHHWALGTGHRAKDLKAVADLLHLDLTVVSP